jgi:carbon monoxide dehydrogenase subunit G
MTRIHERLETALPMEAAFDYVADFANAQTWDPGTEWSRRTASEDGPVEAGATFELGVKMGGRVAPMTYRITEFERPTRVVLVGEGSGVTSIDDIRFQATGNATAVDYAADIQLGGLLRLVQPFLGGRFERIGKDAAAGMAATLGALAASSDAAAQR